MQIELKKVHWSARFSEETDLFDAEIWIDGKKAGSCYNEGHGGPTMISPQALSDKLEAYAKTLPHLDVAYLYGDDKEHTMEQNAEIVIGDILQRWKHERDLKRHLAGKVMFLKDDGKLYSFGPYKGPDKAMKLKACEAMLTAKHPGYIVLNKLAFDEALKLYMQTGAE